jgi:hypothetical protein
MVSVTTRFFRDAEPLRPQKCAGRVSPLAEWRETFAEMHSGAFVKAVLRP